MKMRRLVLPTFGGPFSPLNDVPERLTDGIPPLIFGEQTLRLDYESLLFFDKVSIDKRAYNRLTTAKHPAFSKVAAELKQLCDAGIVEPTCYKATLLARKNEIELVTKSELEHPEQWLAQTSSAISGWDQCQPNLENLFRECYGSPIRVPYGVAYAMEQRGITIDNKDEELEIRKNVTSSRRHRNSSDRQLLSDVFLPYLLHVNSSYAVAQELGGTILDWDNLADIYKTKSLRSMQAIPNEPRSEIAAIRDFFVAVPQIRIENVGQLIKIIEDKRVKFFRNYIEDAIGSDQELDPRAVSQAFITALDGQGVRLERKKWISRVGAVVSWIPGAGLLPSLGEIVADEVVDRSAASCLWVYMFLDAKK